MLSVVIPALNEEDAIAGTIDELRNVLTAANITPFEIIVVNDGSTDATEERARAAGARIVNHPHNVGYGRSLKDGIRAAGYKTICITDADLTYPADAIPGLLEEYKKGFDLVVGARTGHHYSGSVFKGPLRSILKFMVEFTAQRKVPDANSGLRIFDRDTITTYFDHLCDTFSFTTSQTLAYSMTGRFIKHVPIAYKARVGKTKVKLFKDSMRTIQYIIQSMLYYNPLKIFILFAGLATALSLASFGVALATKLTTPYYLGVGGMLIALLIFSMGLLADLLRQIMVK
ncbi:MAG: glycosyltransferase family 2 protein [Hyphomicrobiaceae bacterium]|nr:glycosyltransferase family 2 protein [Hyphomicrobiaceae bacterium]